LTVLQPDSTKTLKYTSSVLGFSDCCTLFNPLLCAYYTDMKHWSGLTNMTQIIIYVVLYWRQ